jgi:hypothetical protein
MSRKNKNDVAAIFAAVEAEGGPAARALAEASVIADGIAALRGRAQLGDQTAKDLLAEARSLGIRA